MGIVSVGQSGPPHENSYLLRGEGAYRRPQSAESGLRRSLNARPDQRYRHDGDV